LPVFAKPKIAPPRTITAAITIPQITLERFDKLPQLLIIYL